MRSTRRKKPKPSKIDSKLLVVTLTLTFIGLIALADASAPVAIRDFGDKFHFVKQQLIWALVGVVFLVVCSAIKYTFWEKIATPLFICSIVFLILVLIPGLGSQVLGARRWLILGPVSFQPSELVKLSMAIYLAKVVSHSKKLSSYFIPVILVSILIMLQPDLGTTIVLLGLAMAQIFVSGVSLFLFLGATILAGLASFLLIITSSYRKERFLTFLEQTQDPLGKGYHIRQILLALGTGGLFGIGLGQSRQKYLFLPESATDSIFAVIAEEIGFLGATTLIFIFAFFVFRSLMIAKNAPDEFSKILAVGITAWIGGQTFLNIGSMVAAVPLTGIPLPFISYGGSSLTTILIAVGILLSISRYSKSLSSRNKTRR